MSKIAICLATLSLSLALGNGCTSDPVGSTGTPATTAGSAQDVQTLADFNAVAAYFAQAHYDFVRATQQWEGAAINSANNPATLALAEAYIDAGANWIAAAQTLNDLSDQLGKSPLLAKRGQTAQGMVVPGGPVGPSPTLVRQLGDVLVQTQQQIDDAKQKYPSYADGAHSDSEKFADEVQLVRQTNTLTVARLGVSAYAGVAGGVVTGGVTYIALAVGAITVSAPAALVVGGATVIGGGVSGAIAWWWSAPSKSCSGTSGTQKSGNRQSSGVCSFAAGSVGPGEAIPSMFPESGGTLTLSIPGYLPITIENFEPPAAGMQLTLDFTPIPLTAENLDITPIVTADETEATATTAADILSVSATPDPVDPAPRQSVLVTVTVFPAVMGISVAYQVSGTDGYSASSTSTTGGDGKISFSIPGGAEGVHDVVNISVGQHGYTVSYTF